MTNMNSGYHGYSMSNRAVQAYDRGEMPRSKWTKEAILEQMEEDGWDEEVIERAKKVSLKALRTVMLRNTGWHHTGKYCRVTYFYSVEEPDFDLKAGTRFYRNCFEDNIKDAVKAGHEEHVKEWKKLSAEMKFLGNLE